MKARASVVVRFGWLASVISLSRISGYRREIVETNVGHGECRVRMQWGVKIPTRDGIHLNATLYIPDVEEQPSPVLFALTPYVAQTLHDFALYFSSHGYPFLTVDARGRGNSDGMFRANGNEPKDACDVIEWLAGQPYCDGKVAMWGGSYAGYVQWAAAKETPAHLVTIVPVASPFRGVDSPAPNNIFLPYRIQWLNLLGGRTSQDKIFGDQPFWNLQFRRWFESGKAFRDIDTFLGNPSTIFQEWMRHPEQDEYWDSFNPTSSQYASISMPVLTITGVYDVNQQGALTHYREHLKNCSAEDRSRHYLVIGPWDHPGTRIPKSEFGGITLGAAALVDLRKIHLEWYEWIMKGGPKPKFLNKRVAYYVMGAERWRYADCLEDITAVVRPLYLQSRCNPVDVLLSGSLTDETANDVGMDHYIYDPRDVSLASLECTVDPASFVDQRLIYASSGRHLVYHSDPFETNTEVSGFFRLSIWISIDQADTDFRASIYEVALDGSSILLTTDSMRARYRKSLRKAELIVSQEPNLYELKHFGFVSREIKKGSRLRLVVGCINSIFCQKNYNSGGVVAEETMEDARTVTVKVMHGPQYSSALYVPYGSQIDDD